MDFRMHHFAEIDSTMNVAKDLIDQSPCPKMIVLADRQTLGRGRIEGRSWKGEAGASLLMTLCLKGDFAGQEAIPLKVGMAVREILSGFAGDPAEPVFRIKWPNDIMGLGREDGPCWGKLGGILCELSRGWLFAGIGLNLRKEAYSDDLSDSATSLEEVAAFVGGEKPFLLPNVEELAKSIAYTVVLRLEKERWREDYERTMWGREREISFLVGHPESGAMRQGRIAGVDESGRLLLSDGSGKTEAFWSGEIYRLRAL